MIKYLPSVTRVLPRSRPPPPRPRPAQQTTRLRDTLSDLKASYKYDFAGRQAIRSLSGGITIHSVFDSQGNRIAEYNEATGALIREYVWFNGAPLAVIEGGVTTFIRADHIGRPVFGTNTGGTKTWTASYLPFGGVRTTTGTPITARFPGQWFQSESGLHQNWMRDYDPTTGRYLQADPLGLVDGASIYGYVKQNPGRWTDPTGEIIPVILVVVVLAALLTPDAANAPGYCDGIVPLTPFAPYINGLIAAVTVAPFTAGFQPAWGKHVNSRRYNPRFSASKYCSRNWSINLSKKSPCKWL